VPLLAVVLIAQFILFVIQRKLSWAIYCDRADLLHFWSMHASDNKFGTQVDSEAKTAQWQINLSCVCNLTASVL